MRSSTSELYPQVPRSIPPRYITFERDDMVLATLLPKGILLHHMPSGRYLRLGIVGKRIWEYCDGVHTFEQIVAAIDSVLPLSTESLRQSPQRAGKVKSTLKTLLRNAFVSEVNGVYFATR